MREEVNVSTIGYNALMHWVEKRTLHLFLSEVVPEEAVPEQQVAPNEEPMQEPTSSHADSSSSVQMYEVEKPEPSTGRKRMASGDDGEGSSRKRRMIGEEDSAEDEEASMALPEKEVVYPSAYAVAMRETESPFVGASPHKKAGEGVSRPPGSVTQLIGELGSLAVQLQTSYAEETGSAVQKDAEIARLQAQLAEARAEAESSKARAERLSGEKVSLLLQVERERSLLENHQASCKWIRGYMDQWKVHHFEQLEVLREAVQAQLREHEEKLRRMTIEYEEELYPQLMQMIAERMYLFLPCIYFANVFA
ncbi:hypothetical protein CTI12_AA122480 [Artemisia annua]|uniref:Uncharacterized protein n=1 Tax=Artemisia annua TaxID=35608 RepID=A0A2U1PQ73_ARTAN|nr:hypothetical protein CTI12_AA122480 [Artemisia annua]